MLNFASSGNYSECLPANKGIDRNYGTLICSEYLTIGYHQQAIYHKYQRNMRAP